MANKGRATFAKRQKEIARQERAREKAAKRVDKEKVKVERTGDYDPDIAGHHPRPAAAAVRPSRRRSRQGGRAGQAVAPPSGRALSPSAPPPRRFPRTPCAPPARCAARRRPPAAGRRPAARGRERAQRVLHAAAIEPRELAPRERQPVEARDRGQHPGIAARASPRRRRRGRPPACRARPRAPRRRWRRARWRPPCPPPAGPSSRRARWGWAAGSARSIARRRGRTGCARCGSRGRGSSRRSPRRAAHRAPGAGLRDRRFERRPRGVDQGLVLRALADVDGDRGVHDPALDVHADVQLGQVSVLVDGLVLRGRAVVRGDRVAGGLDGKGDPPPRRRIASSTASQTSRTRAPATISASPSRRASAAMRPATRRHSRLTDNLSGLLHRFDDLGDPGLGGSPPRGGNSPRRGGLRPRSAPSARPRWRGSCG